MRHRIGIVLAIIMAAALFFPGAWGYLRLLRLPAPGGQLAHLPAGGGALLSDSHVLLTLAAVASTGLLAGILIAVPRISPLAAGLPGLLLLSWTGLFLVSVRQAVDLIPLRSDPFGAGFEAMLLNGILAAAGLALILPMCVPSRWRPREAGDSAGAGTDDFASSWDEPALAPPTELPKRSTPAQDASLASDPAAPVKPGD